MVQIQLPGIIWGPASGFGHESRQGHVLLVQQHLQECVAQSLPTRTLWLDL